jgi:uncharacterized membrane protein
MDPILLVARVLHVGLGVFWAGALIFNAAFLLPAMQAAGPSAGAVAGGLIQRRFLDVLPVAAIVTVISGLWLYWHVSAGFAPAYMRSAAGMAYGTGSALALVALVLGISIVRPSMLRAAALGKAAMEAAPADRERLAGEAMALRSRAGGAARVIAWLLGLATVAMAVARYL